MHLLQTFVYLHHQQQQNDTDMATSRIIVKKDSELNRVRFYQNGQIVYPVSVSGNQAQFEDGQIILF